MIQLAHVASGALAGRHRTGLLDAVVAGLLMHAAMDVIPHGEVHDDAFEGVTGAAGILALAARHGWRSPVTACAVGSVLPDLEHLPRRVGVRTPTLFPTHRIGALHGWETKPLAIPAWLQAVAGGAVIGVLVARGRATEPPERGVGAPRRRQLLEAVAGARRTGRFGSSR